MNNYFINITKHLHLKFHTTSNTVDIGRITSAFNNHVSINKIREVFSEISSNNFDLQNFLRKVSKLNTKKLSTSVSIRATILKQSVETCVVFLTSSVHLAISEYKFTDKLKKSEVIPLYKKHDSLKEEDYPLVSLLPYASKFFEPTFYAQINNCMENKLSKYVTGFHNDTTQHCVMIMLEKWENVLDKGEYVCVLFMDLSKPFDTINRGLLFAELRTYGFSNNALNPMCIF